MPKNGNRGANTKKSNVPFASNAEDLDSNVVFGDAKTTRKSKQSSTAEGSARKGGDVVPASSEDPPKQPDTRKLVSNIRNSSDYPQDGFKNMIWKRFPLPKFLLTPVLSKELILTAGS